MRPRLECATVPGMEIALTPDLEDLGEQLDSRARRREALQHEVDEGLVDLDRGDFEEYENLDDLADAIKAHGRKRLSQSGAP